MIVGSGNDQPTTRIVLDIFGADPNVEFRVAWGGLEAAQYGQGLLQLVRVF